MPPDQKLAPDELQRYARHLTLGEFGVAGQQRLGSARVLLIGAGGLGSPAALYLAAAGVGTLGIVDDDAVDLSNLQRQVLHDTASIGAPKVDSAAARIAGLNPHVRVERHAVRLSSGNARELIRRYDIVLDGSDNFPTRYLVNDACVLEARPLVYGSILRFEGQLSLLATPLGPCYRCVFAEPPPAELVPSCADAGVLGVLPGIVGTLQALEAIKWIARLGDSMAGRLLLFDALPLRFREIAVSRDPGCVVCGDHPTLTDLIDYEEFCAMHSSDAFDRDIEVSPPELARQLASDAPPWLLDVREPWEFDIARIEGANLIPLAQLPRMLDRLPRDRAIVAICHHGGRSLSARDFLVRAGFGPVQSLAGGVEAWATTLDPAMARY